MHRQLREKGLHGSRVGDGAVAFQRGRAGETTSGSLAGFLSWLDKRSQKDPLKVSNVDLVGLHWAPDRPRSCAWCQACSGEPRLATPETVLGFSELLAAAPW